MRSVPRGTVDGQHVDPVVVEQAVGYRLAVDWIADPHWHDVARIFHHRRAAKCSDLRCSRATYGKSTLEQEIEKESAPAVPVRDVRGLDG